MENRWEGRHLSHWTSRCAVRIERTTACSMDLFKLFLREGGERTEIYLGDYLHPGTAAASIAAGRHDQAPFEPSEFDIPDNLYEWNGLK